MPKEAGGTKFASLIAEINLDRTKYDKAIDDIVANAEVTTIKIEKAWKGLGVKTDQYFENQRIAAEKNYRKITESAETTANERLAAEKALADKIEAINKKQYAAVNAYKRESEELIAKQRAIQEGYWNTLGIKSTATIKAQKEEIINATNQIQAQHTKGSQDWINVENAKNAKLKELNKEMVGDHDMSMAAMTRAVLRFYAAYYVISSVIQGIGSIFKSGVESIDKMNLSAIGVAATITNLQGTTGNIVDNYKNNLAYAKALVPVLMQIDAASTANLEQIMMMNKAMAMHGVILDGTNKKQVETMTALATTIQLFTEGQNKEQQATQETNALLNGEVSSRNRIALMIDQMIKKQGDYKDGLKGLNEEAKKHNDWLERISPYLVGIAAASGDISKTWEATSSSLETVWMLIQQEMFAGFYKGLVNSGQEAVGWFRENLPEIGKYFNIVMNSVGDLIGAIWNVLKGFAPAARDFGSAAGMVAYGWGGVLAALRPIGELIGNAINTTYQLVKMVYNATTAVKDLVTGNIDGAKLAWESAKQNYAEAEQLSKRQYQIVTKGIGDAVVAYDKQYAAAKKAGEAFTLPKVKSEKSASGGVVDNLKQSFKDISQMLADQTKENKAYYDEQIKDAEHAAKMARKYNQDELEIIHTLYNAKEKALNDYLEVQYKEADEYVANEAAKAAAAKKTYDANAVLLEKYDKIYTVYSKNWAELENKRSEDVMELINKRIDAEAKMWSEINKFSGQAISAQMAEYNKKAAEFIAKTQDKATAVLWLKEKIRQSDEEQAANQVDFYKQLRGYEEAAYVYSLDVIDLKAKKLKQQGMDEVAIAQWVADKVREAEIIKLKASENTLDGEKAYLLERQRDYLTWAQANYDTTKAMVDGIQDSFSTVLFDTIRGDLKSFSDYWDSFLNSLLKKFTDTIAQMVVEWALGVNNTGGSNGFMAILNAAGSLVSGGVGIASSLASASSVASSAAYTASAYSSLASSSTSGFAMLYHDGGIVGDSSVPTRVMPYTNWSTVPRYHNGLLSDEFPAVLQKGETVIPRGKTVSTKRESSAPININIMAADAKSFDDMCKRNPGAILNPITTALQGNKINKQWKSLLQ